ncbi:hypothetical protein LTR16_010366, partial [Cryomyces antarcticus]
MASTDSDEDDRNSIVSYTMHVSQMYLNLTRKKIGMTRLPHELLLPEERRWDYGTPKAELEPLIDYWH